MSKRLAAILLMALALAGLTVGIAGADSQPVQAVLAEEIDPLDPFTVPDGMTVVFVPPAGDGFADGGDGFADGGDGPAGLTWVLPRPLPDGFSDGGDVPEGFVAVMAQPPDDLFWQGGLVPDGLVPVLAWIPGDGFSDGGDLPEGFVAVFLRSDVVPIPGPVGPGS
jgi:hypothetical protein